MKWTTVVPVPIGFMGTTGVPMVDVPEVEIRGNGVRNCQLDETGVDRVSPGGSTLGNPGFDDAYPLISLEIALHGFFRTCPSAMREGRRGWEK